MKKGKYLKNNRLSINKKNTRNQLEKNTDRTILQKTKTGKSLCLVLSAYINH